MAELEDDLRAADPMRGLDDDTVTPIVTAMWARVQARPNARARRPRWKVIVPAGIALAMATTGAAVSVPFFLGIGENNISVEPDARIAIDYETLAGQRVHCIYSVYVGGDARTARERDVAAALADVDWDGIGQDIYDHAVAHPGLPQPNETWEQDSRESREVMSFQLAMSAMVQQRLPVDLQEVAQLWRSTDTCTGPFV